MNKLTETAYSYTEQCIIDARELKPEATLVEIFGMAVQILHGTFASLQNEQQKTISPDQGAKGTSGEPDQIPRTGTVGRPEESQKGLRGKQTGFTKSGAKKRRSSKKTNQSH